MASYILFIDGDNVSGNYAGALFAAANACGELAEAHVFSTFREDKVTDKKNIPVPPKYTDKGWTADILYKYAIQPHTVPILTAGTSTTDMTIAVYATEKTFTRPEIDVYVLATSDKDFMPLATYLRNRGKKTVILHRETDCKAVIAFNQSVAVAKPQESAEESKKSAANAKSYLTPAQYALPPAKQNAVSNGGQNAQGAVTNPKPSLQEYRQAAEKIGEYLGRVIKTAGNKCYLSTLGGNMKNQIQVLKSYTAQKQPSIALRETFAKYSDLFGKYRLMKENKTSYFIALK